eukprot:CAMPEP_0113638292 /NCGR_PEP_ID=MMETSP0017_2-20120614/20054_1 /TAXON_ID=2856 /ORGANISM="Cylindrotheca closterium" /LENGTH=137 /DNA_ID=CAMNT_0000549381 /DNA_START=257 /DNA_END=671 /DNA_ORIENTATION=+ /assembly_acc=CAM_ASM_000147
MKMMMMMMYHFTLVPVLGLLGSIGSFSLFNGFELALLFITIALLKGITSLDGEQSGISEAPGRERKMEVSSLFLQSNAWETAPIADERRGVALERVFTLSVESVLRVLTTSMISRSFEFAVMTLAFMFVVVNVVVGV